MPNAEMTAAGRMGWSLRFALFFALVATTANAPKLAAADRQGAATALVEPTSMPPGITATEETELKTIYAAFSGHQIWTTEARRRAATSLLASLRRDGIEFGQPETLPSEIAATRVNADIAITRAILQGAHLLTEPTGGSNIIPGWSIPLPAPDVVAAFITAGQNDDFNGLFDALRPSAPEYARLSAAYLRYRGMSGDAWKPIRAPSEIHLEPTDANAEEVTRRLAVFGDLPDNDKTMSALNSAVKRFQTRHGLAIDGRIGPETLAELNVSPTQRTEQIALNLAYWRLLPRVWPQRYIKVNVAAADLELVEGGTPTYATRTIIGDPNHPTPVMSATLSAITFNPEWTVPRSIAVKEFLPRLRRDAEYLQRNNVLIIGRDSDPFGRNLDWRSYTQNYFPFQLRQLPGPKNALGGVKFEMPNKFDVYLHDTPDRSSFTRSARALSHGCVRVECANELAEHLINNPAIWLESDLANALKEQRTVTVKLAQPLPVYLLYFTAFVDKDGRLNFRRDLYDRDAAIQHFILTKRLQQALAAAALTHR